LAVCLHLHGDFPSDVSIEAAGIAVRIEDCVGVLPVAVDALLAWVVREGVRKVVRHSRAQTCTIRVRVDGEVARLELTDDGRGADGTAGSGSGLAGLAERAAASGGCMRAGPLPNGGFALVVEAPVGAVSGARRT
jgi:two-component system, NarL family, sensor histidine kinase DesK